MAGSTRLNSRYGAPARGDGKPSRVKASTASSRSSPRNVSWSATLSSLPARRVTERTVSCPRGRHRQPGRRDRVEPGHLMQSPVDRPPTKLGVLQTRLAGGSRPLSGRPHVESMPATTHLPGVQRRLRFLHAHFFRNQRIGSPVSTSHSRTASWRVEARRSLAIPYSLSETAQDTSTLRRTLVRINH